MAWTKYQYFLSALMVVTGSINTLSTKWADSIDAEGAEGDEHEFNHPFFQASTMFVGEFLCFLAFKILFAVYRSKKDGSEDVKGLTKGNRSFNPLILFFPAMCDMVATSVMYVGLTLTYASSFQMFRGAVIVFVGILSIVFLKRKLKVMHWAGIGLVIIGLAVVGTSDFLNKEDDDDEHNTNDVITGDLLIVAAQVVTAVHMVVQEKFVAGLDIPPLHAVGWEGIFGFIVLALLQIPFYYIHVPDTFSGNPRGVLEDAVDAFIQIGNEPLLILPLGGTVISIAFFNFAGISITKEMSATTRMVLDSIRTVVIWVVSLSFMGQPFQWLQLLGFVFLLTGMAVYNELIPFGKICKGKKRKDEPLELENKVANEA